MSPLETRSHKRYEFSIEVELVFKDEAIKSRFQKQEPRLKGAMLDISKGGLGFNTKYFVPKGAVIDVFFKLPIENDKMSSEIKAEAQICSVIPWKSSLNRVGVKFLNVEEKSKKSITEFVEQNERRKEPRLDIKGL